MEPSAELSFWTRVIRFFTKTIESDLEWYVVGVGETLSSITCFSYKKTTTHSIYTIQTNQKPEQRGKSIENDYEMSEIVLYQNKILMEDNKNVQALANLVGAKDDIVDRVAQLESLVEVSWKVLLKNYLKMLKLTRGGP